ncbi:MAG: hypothetical protein RL007_2923, partial [Bacteroidota bacterium]
LQDCISRLFAIAVIFQTNAVHQVRVSYVQFAHKSLITARLIRTNELLIAEAAFLLPWEKPHTNAFCE